MSKPMRVCLWSGPRNVSTALMYAFRQRPDTTVVDEPLYGHYLALTGLRHPGYQEVLAATDTCGERVVRDVLLGAYATPVVFFKNMAHHTAGLDLDFIDSLTNVLLTRNPREMLVSLTREIPDADVEATALPAQVRLLSRLEATGIEPVVLDATELLRNPRSVLTTLCQRLGIPFSDEMLEWPAGPKPEDGIWAPYWYANVHRSTSFAPYRPKTDPFPEQLEPLAARCRPMYARLAAHAIRAED